MNISSNIIIPPKIDINPNFQIFIKMNNFKTITV